MQMINIHKHSGCQWEGHFKGFHVRPMLHMIASINSQRMNECLDVSYELFIGKISKYANRQAGSLAEPMNEWTN